jgi:hypothetical protein
MKKVALFFLLIFPLFCASQKRGNIWCFGDSSGIDFGNINNPIPINTGLRSRGTCVSISDSSGNLLFYANDRANTAGQNTGLVYNNQHSIMPEGDSIVGEAWYNEMVIVPFPDNDSLYYLFSIFVLSPYGLYYSIVNMKADSGRGDVIAKNIQLQNFPIVDCLIAVKHGNGRDWWLIFRKFDPVNFTPNDEFYSYLITPSGIVNYSIQHVGNTISTGFGKISFNQEANRIAYNNYRGLLELYEFNRCTGIISNPQTIYTENTGPPWPARWSSEFSPNSNYLYVDNTPDTTYLFQYDLTAANIAASEDTLWSTPFPKNCGGALKRAPDNKLYFSCVYDNGIQFPYPYADTMYNVYNMNLGVINSPDSLGTACDFQPYSFYLGGKRTYWGLPNNPDYELGALTGSICDTLTSVHELSEQNQINIFPNPFFNKIAFQYPQHSKTKIKEVTIFDLMGEIVLNKKITQPLYELDLSFLQKGIYFITLTTEKNIFTKKIVKL